MQKKKNYGIKFLIIALLATGVGFAGFFAYKELTKNRGLELLGYQPQAIKSINKHELKETFVAAGHSEVMLYAFQKDENVISYYEYFLIPDGSINADYTTEYVYDNIVKLKSLGYSANETLNIIRVLDDSVLRFIVTKDKPKNIQTFTAALDKQFSNEDSYTLSNCSAAVSDKVFASEISMDLINILLAKQYAVDTIDKLIVQLTKEELELVNKMKFIPELDQLISASAEFKLTLLPRYLMFMRAGKTAEETIAAVNEDKDYVASGSLNYSDMYTSNAKEVKSPASLTALVNKQNYLPSNYEPNDLVYLPSGYYVNYQPLRSVAANALVKMSNAAVKAGYGKILGQSNYRSYSTQAAIYNNNVKAEGKSKADSSSARAGYSEHQTGLTSDLAASGISMGSFAKYNGYKWVLQNAHLYGFIQRYPEKKEYITGFMHEPWHFRYVGVEVATIIYQQGWTLEEYSLVFE